MSPPVSGKELDKLLDTTRARERVSFDAEDGGMTAYFCARFVNSRNEAGHWGPIAAITVSDGSISVLRSAAKRAETAYGRG
ncbi:MAG: hypothetical protein LBD24_04510 [Spirochaetaceae bacterium]|nr:hypothetical protein [Spirochaetaceae bacterium]